MYKRMIGDDGEKQATIYLRKKKYNVITSNFSSHFGEIDIITKKDDTFIFVEVKTRNNTSFGGGASAVTPAKQKKIILTAAEYIQKNNIQSAIRFDVIEINNGVINHIENAFGADGFF